MTKNTKLLSALLFISNLVLGLGFLPAALAKEAPAIECAAVPALMKAFLRTHVTSPQPNNELNKHTAAQFIKRLDPSKLFLLQADVDRVNGDVLKFMENQKAPDCEAINKVHDLLVERAKSQLEYVKKVLTDTYKLDETVEIIVDPEKREFAKNPRESEQRQLTQVHFQISNYLMTDMKLAEAKKQLVHRYELSVKRMEELKNSDFYDHLVNSFAAALDPHSSYMSAEAVEEFQITMRLSLEGIGASLNNEDGYTVIQELIPGGAAARSKQLQPKDKIIAVGQGKTGNMENVIDMDLRDVVKKIRGKSGSTVRLTILRAGKEMERFNIDLVRSKVNLEDEAAQVEYFDRKVGGKKLKFARLDLPSFYGDNTLQERSCSHDMAKLLEQVKQKKVDGLILDLSQNGGGRLEEAVRIAGLFIKTGNVVATKDAQKDVQMLDDEDSRVQYDGPLVVLTSRLSASASEIVAGALQDYQRAVIVGGDHTYGKGSVQAVLDLQNNYGAIKVTTGIFYIPGGNSTQHRGVSADVPLPSIFSTDDLGERYLDYSLRPDAIPVFLSKEANTTPVIWAPVTKDEIGKLKASSEKRVKASKEFADILKEIKETEEHKGVIKLADMRKKESERQKKEGKTKKAAKLLAKEKAMPQINEAISVLEDLYSLRNPTTVAGQSH